MPDPDLIQRIRDEAAQRAGIVHVLLLDAADEIDRLRSERRRPAATITFRIEADCSQALAELERLKATIAETAELRRTAGLGSTGEGAG